MEAQIAHHQYFKVSPQPEVNVIEGTTLELQCVVGNQRGPVQWAKDGFLLGYDRNIPGYPRYSMVGEASVGVHNLKIENVQGSIDTGTFDCQVSQTQQHSSTSNNNKKMIFFCSVAIPR